MEALLAQSENCVHRLAIGIVAAGIVAVPLLFLGGARTPYSNDEQQPLAQSVN